MKTIKDFFSGILGVIIVIFIIIATAYLLIYGARIANTIYPIILRISTISLLISIFIFLPLGIFKKSRHISIYGLYIASFVLGASLWIFSFLVTYFYWGLFGVTVGLFIAGIGVIPLGFIASLFHADWSSVINIVIGCILTYGARALALFWATKMDNENNKINHQNSYAGPQQSDKLIEEAEIVDSNPEKPKENLLYCSNCGKEIGTQVNYCKFCGAKI